MYRKEYLAVIEGCMRFSNCYQTIPDTFYNCSMLGVHTALSWSGDTWSPILLPSLID